MDELAQVFFPARCRFRMKPSMLPPANAIFERTTPRCNLAHLSLSIYLLPSHLPDTEDLQSRLVASTLVDDTFGQSRELHGA